MDFIQQLESTQRAQTSAKPKISRGIFFHVRGNIRDIVVGIMADAENLNSTTGGGSFSCRHGETYRLLV